MPGERLARVGDELRIGRVVDRIDRDDPLRELLGEVLLEVTLEVIFAEARAHQQQMGRDRQMKAKCLMTVHDGELTEQCIGELYADAL